MTRLLKHFVLLTLCLVCCRSEENVTRESKERSDKKEGKQLLDNLEHGGWRSVSSEWQSPDDWIPKDNHPSILNEYSEKPTTRRRRIRKRKRRPSEFEQSTNERNVNPYSLEDTHNPWPEMEEEALRRPHNRRRIIPVYTPDDQSKSQQAYEKVRDPFTALQEVEAKSRLKKKPETTTMSHLKAILKQTGNTLSLSEILQKKNLSLTDLIKGKQQAISALREINTEADTVPSIIIKNINKNDSVERVNEPTTEKRIFVSSHPEIIPSNYKSTTIITFSTSPTIGVTDKSTRNKYTEYRSKYVSLKPKLQSFLPVTSAKLGKLQISMNTKPNQLTTATPLKAFTIDIKDLFGYYSTTTTTKTRSEDGPLRMAFDIKAVEAVIDGRDVPNFTSETPPANSTKRFEKLKPLNAREEIMEVLKDNRSRQSLSRILEVRNMTIEELVAQRERGSSQLHLADIFHNQTKEPEPPNEPLVGIVPSYMERKSKVLQNSNNLKSDTDLSSIIDVTTLPLDLKNEQTTKTSITITSFPTYRIAVDKILKHDQPPPFQLSIWKTLYPNLYSENVQKQHRQEMEQSNDAKVHEILENEVRRFEDIDNTISEAVNNKLNVEINDGNYEHEDSFTRLPNGVKSAIIASTALVAISLLVFLTILIICKWSHKKKKRLCYSDVYSGSRIRSPILETRPKRTIRTIMTETLGRQKRYPQNISDYFWESDKKPFQ